MTKRIFIIAIIIALSVAFAACKRDADPVSQGVDPVNKQAGSLALGGYDTVAYFTDGKAVEGRQEFEHQWRGAAWRFASAANRDLFAASPEKYAPQYGGYCSWAVGHGYTANGDPKAWKIVNGKLYLNYNADVKKKWEEGQKEYIRHSEYPGGIRRARADEVRQKQPTRLVRQAVVGMLPKNRLGRRLATKLKVYAGPDHPHVAQRPAPLPAVR